MNQSDPEAAPGELELLRSFVNTVDLLKEPDALGTVQAAALWCADHGLPLPSNQEECDRLRAFREALRDVLFANNGEIDSVQAWAELERFASSATLVVAIESGTPVLRASGSTVDRTIAALLAIVYDTVARGTFGRLRACRKMSCRFAYYDRSKNGSRAWCSMTTCGNQEKAHRRRRREHG